MNRKNQIKAVLAAAGVLLFLGIVCFLMQRGEQAWGAEHAGEDTGRELERLLWQDISLNGKDYRYSRDYETYLLIGTDGSGNEVDDREEYRGNMADFLLLAIVNRVDKSYAFLQLNRDTMTEITLLNQDGQGEATADMQLCTAHWYGGTPKESCENTRKAVEKLLGGIAVDGYYSINMKDIATLNHAVGGVTVTIESDFSRVDASMKKGETVTLSDEQACTFVRGRTGVDDGENTSRMERQRQYMEAFFEQLQKKAGEDSGFVLSLYETLSETSVTDMSGGLISDLLAAMDGAENGGILTPEGETRLGAHLGDGILHTEFYLDKNDIVSTIKTLYNIQEKEQTD